MKTVAISIIVIILAGVGYWMYSKSSCGEQAERYARLGGVGASAENLQMAYDFEFKNCMNAKGL